MRISRIALLIVVLISTGMVLGPARFSLGANAAAPVLSANNNLGVNCAYGTIGIGGIPIQTKDGNGTLNTLCQWAGDLDGDGALDPLVSDNPSTLPTGSGGGFTADIIITNLNTSINGFDETISYDTHVLDAVLVDQSGLTFGGNVGCGANPSCTLTSALSIDRANGQVRIAQALLGITVGPGGTCSTTANPSCTANTQTLFRIRFDVAGAGTSPINFSSDPTRNVIVNPNSVRHTTQNGGLSTNSLFALINSVNSFRNGYNVSWTFSPNPEVPGQSLTFSATASCGNCTGPFAYQWDFSSIDSPSYVGKLDATGATVTVSAPPPVINRVTLRVSDSTSPPHNVTATRQLPLAGTATGPDTVAQGTASTAFNAKWLGGVVTTTSGYSGLWRFCPGSALVKTVCNTPTSPVSQSGSSITQTNTVSSVTFSFAGLYNDLFQTSDTAVSQISAIPSTTVEPIAVNVTGATPAYNLTVASLTSSIPVGGAAALTASVTYAGGYPSAFQSSSFSYTFFWGDMSNTTVSGGRAVSASHTYNTMGSFVVRVVARETGVVAVSHIQENGFLLTPIQVGASALSVSITTAPTSATVNVPVMFGATASGGAPPYSFSWNFEDNTGNQRVLGPNPNLILHTYTSTGTFTVHANVTDSTSTTASATPAMIVVSNSPRLNQTILGVWNSAHSASNITITDGSLAPGASFTVDINITNSPPFNAFETALFYDPTNLTLTSYNVTTGTMFTNPFVATVHNSTGAFRISVANLGMITFQGSGTLFHVTFRIDGFGASPLVLAAAVPDPSGFSQGSDGLTPDWSRLVVSSPSPTHPVETNIAIANGYFRNVAGPNRLSPVASFTFSPSLPAPGQLASFDASTSFDPDKPPTQAGGGIKQCLWDFGDGSFATGCPIVTHTFADLAGRRFAGNFTVLLKAIDNDTGYMGMKFLVVTIASPSLAVSIASAPTSGTVGIPVSITATASGGTPPYTFFWNFGDNLGNQAGGSTNPNTMTHTYTALGTFTVHTNVTDSTGAKASTTPFTITVSPLPPTGQAIIGVWNSAHSTSNITMTDGSLGPGATFTIDINITNAPLFNAFETALFYDPTNITLTSYDVTTGTICPNPFITPVRNSTGAFRIGVSNLGGFCSQGNGTLFHVTFRVRGFGASPLVLAPVLPNPSSLAEGADGYTPDWTRLIISSSTSTNPVETPITVANGYFRNIAGQNRLSPVALFGFSPLSPAAGQTVTFDASASFDPDNRTGRGIREYVWDFGAITSRGNKAFGGPLNSTSYSFAGNFTVLLTVFDTDTGYMGMKALVITIGPPPVTGDFSINASPSSLTVFRGSTVNAPILSMTSLNGFVGTVTVSGSFVPGLTILFNSTSSLNVSLVAGQTVHILLTVATFTSTPLGTFVETVSAVSTSNGVVLAHTTDVGITILAPPSDQPPVAFFTFSPQNPGVGQSVAFNGAGSFDPDGFVVSWTWNFGDGQFGSGEFPFHTYNAPGNYTVTLTVTDNGGQSGMTTMIVPVRSIPQHDVAIDFVQAPTQAVTTEKVTITVGIENTGISDSTVNITAYWDSHVAGSIKNAFVPANFGPFHQVFYFYVPWDTTGVPAGNHTISAKVFLSDDPTLADNSFTDGQTTILPPPVLTMVPSNGSLGTKVVVRGSGFPTAQGFFGPQVDFIEVTFDDMLLGFTTTTNGTFSFTFNVPHAQPGLHLIKAFDQFSGAHTIASFQVLPEPGNLVVTVNTAAVYFPGDTATIYVLATLDGNPAGPSGLQIQIILIRPNGTIATLGTVLTGPGLYKATYTIPRPHSIGTYTLVVTAHRTTGVDVLALGGFEVKQSWIVANAPSIIGGTTVASVLGVALLARRKNTSRRDSEAPAYSLGVE